MISAERLQELISEYESETKDALSVNMFFTDHGIEPEFVYMLGRQFTAGIEREKIRDRKMAISSAWVQGFGFALLAAESLR